ncbi:MAG: tetratricopeptide repeat protein [Elainellaceae cyanobacterium]
MRQPTTQYWTWLRTIPQFAVMAFLIGIFWPLFPPGNKVIAVGSAALVYIVYSQSSRRLLAAKHRLGIREAGRKNYDQSIQYFRESVEFFSNHSWLDNYRAVFLMSPSAWTYREMGLLNIAVNYAAQGEVGRAKETLADLLQEFPENDYAQQYLAFIDKVAGDS